MDKNGMPTPNLKKTDELSLADNTLTAASISNAPTVTPTPDQPDLNPTSTQGIVKVFISYAREDQQLHERLVRYLVPLKNAGKITIWHDQEILPGTNFDDEIKTRLKGADVILLLVSADFLASDYCYGVEMEQALKRHEDGEARVIPIILKPADWQDTRLGRLQVLPTDATAVTQWNDQDAALADVVQGIRKVVDKLLQEDEDVKTRIIEIWSNLRSQIHSASANVKKITSRLLFQSLLLTGYCLCVGLALFALSLPYWITFFLVIPFLILIVFILVEAKSAYTDVKTGDRRAFLSTLSAMTIGLLALGSLAQRMGRLTQLRMELLPTGNTGPSDTRPLENTLSDLLGLPVSSGRGQTYADTINALAKGDVEVAWLGPFSYLRAHQIYGARAILCDLTPEHQKTYQSYIIANAKANILRVEDLRGKRFALVDHNSTSGRVIPLYELKKAGLDPDKDIDSYYAGSHENSLEEVLNEHASAGAVASDVYDAALKGGQFHEGDLTILMKSGDIPKGPIAIRKDIQHDDELRIEDAFLSVEEIDPAISHTMGNGGFSKITDRSYEFLIPIVKELNIDMSTLE